MQLSSISLAITRIGRVAGFSPLSLFSSSEQGVWYDPSDLSTMFQDSAGTTPVTAAGQTVGLVLDKSKGLVLGSEIVVNGNMNSATGWNIGAEWEISGGQATFTGAGSYTGIGQPTVIPEGKVLKVSVDIISISGGASLRFGLGGTFLANPNYTTIGTKTFYYSNPTGEKYSWAFDANGGGAGKSIVIDNVTIQYVAGNHATQATASKRPQYQTDGTYHWLQRDGVDDELVTTFQSSLGSSCTVGKELYPSNTTSILTAQTIGTSYTDTQSSYQVVITNDALTGQETTDLTAYLGAKSP